MPLSAAGRQPGARLAVLRGYLVLVGGTGATRLLAFVTGVLLARALGPSQFGEIAIFLTILGFWTSADFLDSTFVRFANAEPGGDTAGYLRATLVLKLAWNAVLLALAFPLAHALADWVFDKPGLFTAIFVSLLCGLGLNLVSLSAAIHLSRERFLGFVSVTAAFYALSFALVVVVLALPGRTSTTAVYAAYLAAAAAAGVYGLRVVYRTVGRLELDRPLLRRLLSFSRWLFGANMIYMLSQRLDLFLLAGLGSLVDLGHYGAALRIAVTVALFTGVLAPALLPKASRIHESPELLRPYLRQGALLSAAIVALGAAVAIAAPLLVSTLFGDSYREAVPIVRILLIGTCFIAIYTPLSQLFMTSDDPRRMFHLSALRLVAIAGLGALLVPRWGASGAALATSLTELVALVYVAVVIRRRLHAVRAGDAV